MDYDYGDDDQMISTLEDGQNKQVIDDIIYNDCNMDEAVEPLLAFENNPDISRFTQPSQPISIFAIYNKK